MPFPWAASFSFDPDDPSERRMIEGISDSVRNGILVGADWNVTILTPEGPMADIRTLHDARYQVANSIANLYDFGVDTVQNFAGWESTVPGDEWTRSLHLAPDVQDVDETSETAYLTIRFVPDSAMPVEVYAIDGRGNVFGSFELPDSARP